MGRLLDRRINARQVGVARIGVALAVLLGWASSAETLPRLANAALLRVPYVDWFPDPDAPVVALLLGAWGIAALLFLVGWRTRVAGAVLAAALASVLFIDQQMYNNYLYLMVLSVGLLTVADSGAALSLDARRRQAQETIPAWPVILLCVQVSIVYGFAAIAKLNPDFLSGSVVASYLRRDGPLAVPDAWRSLEPMLVLSVLAVCTEALLAVALWSRRWRPAALVLGLGLHIGITGWLVSTNSLFVFSILMFALFIPFLDAPPRGHVVVWDDGCGFCAGWVRWFRRLVWMGALQFVPRSALAGASLPVSEEAATEALQLVFPSGRVRSGFAAVVGVAELLPLAFLWAPLLRLPFVAAVGERVYRRVAARRTCPLPAMSPAG
jgi:predicted DCC family thiol-disulfide oxidoreductase YuxK